ncbi:MAG: 30S ribosomal protein S12 methylthiotransferase RimO [Alphaproteobacteria bacterium]|nr:30S ribosomal protein S12 methylthiotransferase RimO [Alphaproteobacteria bacterium]
MEKRKKIKIGFVSLGCSKNTIDTEIMLNYLSEADYELTTKAKSAEVVIVNTCGFIGDAKQESYSVLEELSKLKAKGKLKKIVVAGCLAERYRDKILKELPLVDAVMGVGSIHQVVDVVNKTFEQDKTTLFEDASKSQIGGNRMLITDAYSTYIKISEGCNNKCTYCTIPSIRGKYRSRTMEDILDEAKNLEKAGTKELNIIAQDTSTYGIDLYGKLALPELLRKITSETNIPWIRLFYCYPDKITDELIQEIKTNPKVLHYIDIPVQHINDSVLKRMNRHGKKEDIVKMLNKLREEIPDIIIRTTAIVGFPGETEDQFNELVDFVSEGKFNRFGAFKYSREEGTPAYNLSDQIDDEEKTNRYERIMEVQHDISLEHQQKFIGTTQLVLCDGYDEDKEMYFGHNYANSPDIDGLIYFNSKYGPQIGDFVSVKIKEVDPYDLYGTEQKKKN